MGKAAAEAPPAAKEPRAEESDSEQPPKTRKITVSAKCMRIVGREAAVLAHSNQVEALWKFWKKRGTAPLPAFDKDTAEPIMNEEGQVNRWMFNDEVPCAQCDSKVFINYKRDVACLCCGTAWTDTPTALQDLVLEAVEVEVN